MGLPDCFAVLEHGSVTSTRAVVESMNLFPAASAYGRANGKKHDFVRGKVYKWDFSGMLANGLGTVEFRQPPGSTSLREATGWITLALTFVAAVVGGGFEVVDRDNGARLEELWCLLVAGAGSLGWE